MLQELLKNPAFAELYKNAPHVNNIEVPKIELGGFVPPTSVIPPVVQTPIILPITPNLTPRVPSKTASKNSNGSWVLPAIILIGGFYAIYKFTRLLESEKEKSKKNKN